MLQTIYESVEFASFFLYLPKLKNCLSLVTVFSKKYVTYRHSFAYLS